MKREQLHIITAKRRTEFFIADTSLREGYI